MTKLINKTMAGFVAGLVITTSTLSAGYKGSIDTDKDSIFSGTDMDKDSIFSGTDMDKDSIFYGTDMKKPTMEQLATSNLTSIPLKLQPGYIYDTGGSFEFAGITVNKKDYNRYVQYGEYLILAYDVGSNIMIVVVVVAGGVVLAPAAVAAIAAMSTKKIAAKMVFSGGKTITKEVAEKAAKTFNKMEAQAKNLASAVKSKADATLEAVLTKPTGARPNPNKFRNDTLANTKMNAKGEYKDAYTGKYHPKEDMQADHIMPWSKGGSNSQANAAMTHKNINSAKNAKIDYGMMTKGYIGNRVVRETTVKAGITTGMVGAGAAAP